MEVRLRLSSSGGCGGGPAAATGGRSSGASAEEFGPRSGAEWNGWLLLQELLLQRRESHVSTMDATSMFRSYNMVHSQFGFNIARSSILPNIAHRNHYRTASKIYECSEVGTTLNFSDTVLIATYSGIRSAFLHSTLLTILHSQS